MFITLHLANYSEVRINANLIESYGEITKETYPECGDTEGLTYVITAGMREISNPYIVKESPNQIDDIIDGRSWIGDYE